MKGKIAVMGGFSFSAKRNPVGSRRHFFVDSSLKGKKESCDRN